MCVCPLTAPEKVRFISIAEPFAHAGSTPRMTFSRLPASFKVQLNFHPFREVFSDPPTQSLPPPSSQYCSVMARLELTKTMKC